MQHYSVNYSDICEKYINIYMLPESLASVIEKLHGSSAIWNVRNTDSYKQNIHWFIRYHSQLMPTTDTVALLQQMVCFAAGAGAGHRLFSRAIFNS